jgi:hypothetical protein
MTLWYSCDLEGAHSSQGTKKRELSTEIERLYPATVLSSRGVSFANELSDLEKRRALIDGWWAPAVTKQGGSWREADAKFPRAVTASTRTFWRLPR